MRVLRSENFACVEFHMLYFLSCFQLADDLCLDLYNVSDLPVTL